MHLQFIHLAKNLSDLINVICGKNFCQGHWRKRSNFCVKYINVCQASIKLFLYLLKDIIFHWPWKLIKSIIHENICHTCILYLYLSTSHSDILSYYIWHLNDKLKRGKVYTSWRNTLTDLSDSVSQLATSSHDLFILIWFFTSQSTIFQLHRDGTSWVEPVLS